MKNKNCPKCEGKGYFIKDNLLTGNKIKIPCLCVPKGLEKHPMFKKEIIKAKEKYYLC